jgi:hypothetical protein
VERPEQYMIVKLKRWRLKSLPVPAEAALSSIETAS